MLPTAGLSAQFTAVFVVPVTLAENCCVCEALSVAVVGVMETATSGFTVMVALALLVASAALVALTVTDCVLVMLDGGV
jgi:hypothetical protein